MGINQIYVNLPVKDILETKEFWAKLGFSINDKFSDENAICVIMKEDQIYAMFLKEEYFQTFINKPIAKGDTTQVFFAIGVDSREEVDQLVKIALENGGLQYEEPQDYGWMYQNSFLDLNGHGWGITYSDISQLPEE
ncbi:glyoxalase/bleomycin resistance/extradiol dioxygenase family protein [Chryseobacterium nematophagum]|uniref:Glyoxalase/bleomycin resistance/extradiol dioxygenase family protein n=1 Tax=Chryseobacterium nematophagum TaxID=2305228 RepID=A0A3M7LAB7_9FLAO|nr:VOC family protein [Chryseobacterium nematophagum]RMZ58492.1 glyoxalase/bleomycin resistance/extradiol dioxygenase family protein [Chryseobacterium nematophagum]